MRPRRCSREASGLQLPIVGAVTRPYFFAGLVFLAIALPSLLVRAALNQRSEDLVRLQTTLTGDQVALRLEGFVEARLSPVRILQDQWRANAIHDEETFGKHAAGLRGHVEGLVALNWIDGDGVIRWVVPPGPNAAARGKRLRAHPVAGPVLAAAERSGALRLTPPLTLYQGGRGFTAYVPLQDEQGRPAGYLNAVFRTRPLVELCLAHELEEGFGVSIHDGEAPLYASDAGPAAGEPFAVTRALRVGDRTWSLRLTPAQAVLEPLATLTPDLLALAGILLACAMAWTSAAFLKGRQLRQAEEVERARLHLILEATTDLVGMADAEGRVRYLNRAGRRALGIGDDEPLEGRQISDFHPPEGGALAEALPTVVAEGSWQSETVLRSLTGQEFPVSQVVLGHVDAAGELSYISTIARDLTEPRRRAAEHTALLAKVQEKQRIETMGTLAGGIAHDFNNLLMIVRGFSELTLAQLGAEAAQAGPRENLTQILSACDQAKDLIGQILTFARQSPREPEELELVPLVEGVASLLRATLPLGVALRLRLGEGAAVHADRSQLQQVVMNLCVNAVTALGGEGQLEVGIRALEEERAALPDLRPGEAIEVYVKDDGPGMSQEVRARIFDPFFTTRKGSGGTGLGLSVVHGILEAHGGGIEVESTLGEGTTMRAFLPALRVGAAPAPGAASEVEPRIIAGPGLEPSPVSSPVPSPGFRPERGRVLIADDQESVVRVLKRSLSLMGYTVTVAVSPAQVRELFALDASAYDILLTDLTFAGDEVDGVDLARDLVEAHPELPVVLMTGSNDRDSDELSAAGVREVLLKPFSMTTLQEVLDEHLAPPSA